jgi:DNA-binding HxlR family transcriptional regulator
MPKARWDGYERFCPFARALDVVGERWTLVIVHNLLGSPARFTDLKTSLPGIGTNVLSDRLRKLEAVGVIHRVLGDVGDGVRYQLTQRGLDLAPAMTELRRWGADELLAETATPRNYDHSYAIPDALHLDETYEWRIDERRFSLTIRRQVLIQKSGPADSPALTVATTLDFMREWAAGETNWDTGRASGIVQTQGPDDAWDRMLVATNYPGRPRDLTARLIDAARTRQTE